MGNSQSAVRRYRKQKGLCVTCGVKLPAARKAVNCSDCSKRYNEWQKEKRARAKANGLCLLCRSSPRREGRTDCEKCAELKSELYAKRKQGAIVSGQPLKIEVLRAERIAAGNCERCGKQRDGRSKRHCRKCRERINWKDGQLRGRAKDLGLCGNCRRRPPRKGFANCVECAASQRVASLQTVNKRLSAKVCTKCGCGDADQLIKGRKYIVCRDCYFKATANSRLGKQSYWRELKRQFEKQGGRCAYTGEVLVLGVNDSVNHIEPVSRFPEKSQSIANIEWTTRAVNLAKRNLTKQEFIQLVRAIVTYTQGRED